jgi:hypothetical protein
MSSTSHHTPTHSNTSGDLFLTIGPGYDHRQISGWYPRFMRDEVLAEWRQDEEESALHLFCHVSGGLVLGLAHWRYLIFRPRRIERWGKPADYKI